MMAITHSALGVLTYAGIVALAGGKHRSGGAGRGGTRLAVARY